MPVVLDEFSYLTSATPALPSLVQAALSPARRRRRPARLIVCGSALNVMGSMLTAAAPLGGRAGLELIVRPFDYRTAGAFSVLGARPAPLARVSRVRGPRRDAGLRA